MYLSGWQQGRPADLSQSPKIGGIAIGQTRGHDLLRRFSEDRGWNRKVIHRDSASFDCRKEAQLIVGLSGEGGGEIGGSERGEERLLLYMTDIVVHDLYIAWRQHWVWSPRISTSCWWITARNSDLCAYSITSITSPMQKVQLAQNISPSPTDRPPSLLH